MATAEVNFEMDERLWWQVRKHAQYQGMSIGEMTIKALGQYMIDNPVVLAPSERAGASGLPAMAGQATSSTETAGQISLTQDQRETALSGSR